MTSRRSFLAALAAAFVAPDPERLLWVPGARVISVPAPRTLDYAAFLQWDDAFRAYQDAYVASHAAWLERVRRGERVRLIG